ncbi:hypothetical protein EPYR_03556 [Erwinia pyrifoliae DSM 12163]|nr:hypothetical protein EPYR_03556 [Erwinia pyrifoliae DSM 12163]
MVSADAKYGKPSAGSKPFIRPGAPLYNGGVDHEAHQ